MHEKHRPAKVLFIVTLATASLMSFMAGSAQAGWLIGFSELTSGTEKVLAKNHTTSKLIVESLNFEIRCAAANSTELTINGSPETTKAEATGGVAFQLCTAYEKSTGKEQKNCKPKEPISVGLKASVTLHNKINYVLINNGFKIGKVEINLPFTTIVLPELCALAETSEVTGSLVAECGVLEAGSFAGENCSVQRKAHLLKPAASELFFFDKMKFGENAARFEGIGSVELEPSEFWSGEV